MRTSSAIDDTLPKGGTCRYCGRLFDINEVVLGAYVEFYLANRDSCSCPTCFSQTIYGATNLPEENVLFRLSFADTAPSTLLQRASVWSAGKQPGGS